MILKLKLHRFASQQPYTIEFTIVSHHLLETDIVCRSGYKITTPGEIVVRFFDIATLCIGCILQGYLVAIFKPEAGAALTANESRSSKVQVANPIANCACLDIKIISSRMISDVDTGPLQDVETSLTRSGSIAASN